jgi:hypothetical protein
MPKTRLFFTDAQFFPRFSTLPLRLLRCVAVVRILNGLKRKYRHPRPPLSNSNHAVFNASGRTGRRDRLDREHCRIGSGTRPWVLATQATRLGGNEFTCGGGQIGPGFNAARMPHKKPRPHAVVFFPDFHSRLKNPARVIRYGEVDFRTRPRTTRIF